VSTLSIVNFLKQSDIFYQFTPTQLELVANLCQEVTYQKDDLIFKENSGSKELYIIIQGEVDIIVDPSLVSTTEDGIENKTIATMRRGQSLRSCFQMMVCGQLQPVAKRTPAFDHPACKLIMLDTYPQLIRNV
jgi:signal-transduction protein with cAMP-binding, CBS, and nucleotidyltransferase domain